MAAIGQTGATSFGKSERDRARLSAGFASKVVWLLLPRDEGVFDGASTADVVTCVSPVQVYLDLAAHPERSKAAETLRAELLNWRATWAAAC